MRKIVLLILLAHLFGCQCFKKSAEKQCETIGAVQDLTDVKGCGMLISLPNGELLNPVSLPGGFVLRDKQQINFTYKENYDADNTCISGQIMADITCIHEIKPDTIMPKCFDTKNPFEVPWMDRAIDYYNANQILKYKKDNEWRYLFKAIPESYLYDCKGNLICKTSGDMHDDCAQQHILPLGRGKVIWQGEGVWD